MILQEVTSEQIAAAEAANKFDKLRVLGTLVLAWTSTQDPEKGLIRLRWKGILSFTFRVKHLEEVIELICGPVPRIAQ